LREGVIVRPIGEYGLERHLRVTVGLPAENERFLAALERVLT
jgi:histidinol-phosphate aminotransferase